MSYRHLFSEGKIGSMTLRNRTVLPAMATRMAEPDYTIGERLIQYHALRAKNGCAMNILEFTAVHPTTHFNCTPALYDDCFIPSMKALADALHKEGGKLCVQLWHCGRQASKEQTMGFEIMAPSAIPVRPGFETPREMTLKEIDEIIEAFGDAAVRAKASGADAVEVHGAHGYLIGQFSSAWSNHRTDEYGGSLENRAKFAVKVIQNVRKKVGSDYPIVFRLTAQEKVPGEGGMTTDEAVEIAKLAEKAGADAIHVSQGTYGDMWDMIPPIEQAPGFNVHNAVAVKKAVSVPVIAVGRINNPALAEQVLAEGCADFVSIGRAQLADPEFIKKAYEGRADEIVKCIACNQGCIGRYGKSPNGNHLTCLRNPVCGHEFLYKYTPSESPKKVLIAGGGIGGLEAARFLNDRGHKVVVCEAQPTCGGQFLLAGIPPKKQEIADALRWTERTVRQNGIEIRVNTPVDAALLDEMKPDYLVVATGAQPVVPKIPGAEKTVLAMDVLTGEKQVGKKVVVIGGGLVGVETAEYLTSLGKDVTIVEMLDKLSPKADIYKRHYVDEYIEKQQIPVYLNSKCLEITDSAVKIQQADGTEKMLEADGVVIAAGYRSRSELLELAKEKGIPATAIGDANEPRLAIDAIKEAFDCANAL